MIKVIMKWSLVLLVGVILSLAIGCQKSQLFDVRGNWELTTISFMFNETAIYVFQGGDDQGTVSIDASQLGSGTYSLSGSDINFTYVSNLFGGQFFVFSGQFVDEDSMEGSVNIYQATASGEYLTTQWNARRK